ncbi:DUF4174 domain-containing protein [Pelagovum pacificum]|uniref:DUF4174 domain-containing protein n=1 Tax=Pelagovum pacificum TaxID=2588711 RepID=A0A5C5GCK0_9RHOB|nr:DUF4174 domain-containing protein [Pelagovum pacificum]QQA41320.1 DUF4174 domain-containing protein [Pelagovum pacificum]TNY31874.1 DUF4174 domain-containing protein [Pelagovum pacificum]
MNRLFMALAAILLLPPAVSAQEAAPTDQPTGAPITAVERWQAAPDRVFEAAEIELEDFIWIARPVVIFADTRADPNFRRQLEMLSERIDDLVERDVLLVIDTDPSAESSVRMRLRPRGFMMALIGKDGQVKLRKPLPWSARELTRSIDKTPLRQQEVEERRIERQPVQ